MTAVSDLRALAEEALAYNWIQQCPGDWKHMAKPNTVLVHDLARGYLALLDRLARLQAVADAARKTRTGYVLRRREAERELDAALAALGEQQETRL